MESSENRVTVYHAAPLCKKCDNEVSAVQRVSEKAGISMRVTFSPWKRIKYGLQLMAMPVVVIDNRPFSVLGAFGEDALAAELKRKDQQIR